MSGRKRYREYHRNGATKIPRTTAWRHKKKLIQICNTTVSAISEDSGSTGVVKLKSQQFVKVKGRNCYRQDPFAPVPRQTIWLDTSKLTSREFNNSPLSNSDGEEDEAGTSKQFNGDESSEGDADIGEGYVDDLGGDGERIEEKYDENNSDIEDGIGEKYENHSKHENRISHRYNENHGEVENRIGERYDDYSEHEDGIGEKYGENYRGDEKSNGKRYDEDCSGKEDCSGDGKRIVEGYNEYYGEYEVVEEEYVEDSSQEEEEEMGDSYDSRKEDYSDKNCSGEENQSSDEEEIGQRSSEENIQEFQSFSSETGHHFSPLYTGAPLSKEASWLSIYQYAISNQLTDTATKQLLELIKLHVPSSDLCPSSLYKLKKTLGGKTDIVNIYYCSNCLKEVPKQCPSIECKKKKAQICYFSILPFENCLSNIFEEHWETVQYPFTRQIQANYIQDIQDGTEYIELMKSGNFLSTPEHTGLIMCCDGVPLFKSSGQSLWPVELSIASLPPSIRMNVDYLLLAGIWLGPVKPNMQAILQPILEKINSLQTEIHTPEGIKQLEAKLLLGVFDLPAKAAAVNMMQFNGKYGCLYCLDEGLHVSHRRIYLPSERHKPRNMADVCKWAEEATALRKAIFGVKGPSVLSSSINIVESIPIDYMHAILEGITKALLTSWFDSKNHNTLFYLGRKTSAINSALLRIKPPYEFRRTPRPIETAKYWKASELRAWLLFYSIPILIGANFPPDYINHYSLLVAALHVLLNGCISKSHLEMAHLMLVRFYELMPVLYPDTMCTLNVHSVIHLCDCVHRWGPLWCYSAFGFENLNGYIKRHCHGTRNVLPQLIQGIKMRQSLPLLKNELKLQENTNTMDFLKKLCGEQENISGPLGKIVHKSLSRNEVKAIQEAGFSIESSNVPIFPRYKQGNLTMSVSKKCNSRDNSICKLLLKTPTSEVQEFFGSVQKFCFVNHSPVAIVAIFEKTNESVISIPPQRHCLSLLENDHKAAQIFNWFAFKVKKLSLSRKLIALNVENIIGKVIHIPVKHSPTDIIITLPNVVEHH